MTKTTDSHFIDSKISESALDSQINELAHNIIESCTKNALQVATVESCTGGMIAQSITSIGGSSAVFEYGFVTYSEKAKQKLVGVKSKTLESYGVVSEEVCSEMASGGLRESNAYICVSVSGFAGPAGANDSHEVGTVCFGLATKNSDNDSVEIFTEKKVFPGPSRQDVRKQATCHALSLIYKACKQELT